MPNLSQMFAVASTGIGTAGKVANDITQADAAGVSGQYQKKQFELNEQIANLKQKQVGAQEQFEIERQQEKTGEMIGSERSGYAGQGVNVNTGTAKTVQGQTKEFGEEDIAQIKANAFMKAFGYKTEALNDQNMATLSDFEAKNKQRNGLFGAISDFGGGAFKAASELEQ